MDDIRPRLVLVIAAIGLISIVAIALRVLSGGPVSVVAPDSGVAVARPATFGEESLVRLAGTVRSETGGPIPGALACDHPAFSAPTTCVRSQPDGSFALSVPAGFHKLEVVPPVASAYLGTWYPDSDRSRDAELLDLRRGDKAGLDVRLAFGYRVSGRVGMTGEAAVADVQACASATERPAEWVCARTDTEGRYLLTIPGGEYLMFFVPPDDSRLIPRWWRDGLQVLAADPLQVKEDLSGIDVQLVPGFLVFGRVTSTSGKPVESALVCVDTPFPTGRICRPTDKGGNYSVSVRRGTFVVQFLPPTTSGVIKAWYPNTPDPNAAQNVSVTFTDVRVDGVLRPGKLVWGSVRGADGRPLEGATLNVYDAERACCAFVAGGTTGASGDYGIIVPTGRFWLEVFPPFGQPYVSGFYGGGSRRVLEVREKDTDLVADVALEPVP